LPFAFAKAKVRATVETNRGRVLRGTDCTFAGHQIVNILM